MAYWADLATYFLQVHQKAFQDHLLAFLDFQEEYLASDDSFSVLQVAWAVLQEVSLGQESDHDRVHQTAYHFHLEAFLDHQAYLPHLLTYSTHLEALQELEVLQVAFHVLQVPQVAYQDLLMAFQDLLMAFQAPLVASQVLLQEAGQDQLQEVSQILQVACQAHVLTFQDLPYYLKDQMMKVRH